MRHEEEKRHPKEQEVKLTSGSMKDPMWLVREGPILEWLPVALSSQAKGLISRCVTCDGVGEESVLLGQEERERTKKTLL